MTSIGIVAYTATDLGDRVEVFRVACGEVEHIETEDWEELTSFLTEDKGEALHIVWNLAQFTNRIFSLLPVSVQKELEKKVRVTYRGVRIFNVEHLLGLTKAKLVKGNIYDRLENNFYGISHWLPAEVKEPELPRGLEQLGYNIVEGLEKLGIYPSKLTSPIGLFSEQLDSEKLPTIYNFNEEWLEAMDWANQVAGYEWNKEYRQTKGRVHQYDLVSAYPSIMLNLPDTRQFTLSTPEHCDWGIIEGSIDSKSKMPPVDKKAHYFTLEELDWLEGHNLIDNIKLGKGWYFKVGSSKPYRAIVSKLLQARHNNNGDMVSTIAKRIANGLSGKFDQLNKDGSLGELYNPILALMVRSRCRLKVGDFIYDNNLQDKVARVQVDSVYTTEHIKLPKESLPGQFRKVK